MQSRRLAACFALALALLATPALAYAQPADTPSAGDPGAPPAPSPPPRGNGGQMMQRFEAANTTHDGRLTAQQAQNAHLMVISKHFADIDINHRGYVTVDDIKAWHARTMATRTPPQPSSPPPQ